MSRLVSSVLLVFLEQLHQGELGVVHQRGHAELSSAARDVLCSFPLNGILRGGAGNSTPAAAGSREGGDGVARAIQD